MATETVTRYVSDSEAEELLRDCEPWGAIEEPGLVRRLLATRTALLDAIEKAASCGWDGQMRDRLSALAAQIRGGK